MKRKKKRPDFNQSEPEFLISCLDRHPDWAVIVCLVGGGQEINTGEAGISEWIDSLARKFPGWDVHISPRLTDAEYGAGRVIAGLKGTPLKVEYKDELHLAVSLRSFRAERVSELVKKVLDLEAGAAHFIGGLCHASTAQRSCATPPRRFSLKNRLRPCGPGARHNYAAL